MDIMWSKPVTDFPRKHYFGNIPGKHQHQAGCKNDNSLFDCVIDEGGGCGKPK